MRHSELKQGPRAKPPGGESPGRGGDEPPPFASWAALYALVIAGLLLMIALCWAITRWAA